MFLKLLKPAVIFFGLIFFSVVSAVYTNIDSTDKYVWSERVGWINFGADRGGVVVSDTRITGYAWSQNFGWINLAPSVSGVVNDGNGNLSGHAWGENLGWINFSGVRIDSNGYFRGFASGDITGRIRFNCADAPDTCGNYDFKLRTSWRPPDVPVLQPGPPVPRVYHSLSISKTGNGSGTVTSNPVGINCGNDCSANYVENTSVTLIAVPSTGSAFTGWSGACSGADATCVVAIDSDKSVTAAFTIVLPGTKWCEKERIYVPETEWTEERCVPLATKWCELEKRYILELEWTRQRCVPPDTRLCEKENTYIPIQEWNRERCYQWCQNENRYILPAEWSEVRCSPPGARWCEREEQYISEAEWSELRCALPATKWCRKEERYIPTTEWSEERCTPLVIEENVRWCPIEGRDIPENEWTVLRCIVPPLPSLPPLSPIIAETIKEIDIFFESPQGEITSKTITTGGLVLGTTVLLSSFSLWDILLLPFRLLGIVLFKWRKKMKPWGTAYDSVTKQPLDPAYVILQDPAGKEIDSAITDLDGRYGFLSKIGNYKMKANKTNYIFPSQKLAGRTNDEIYNDLYFGAEFQINKENEVIIKNIPLDPLKFDWNEFIKRKKGLLKFHSQFDVYLRRISDWFFVFGFIVSIVAFYFAPYPYNTIILGLYIFLLTLRIFGVKPRTYGVVIEKETGYPLSFAIIRVVSSELEKEIFHRITDKLGRYYCLVSKGKYYLKIEKKNEDGSYSHIYTSRVINAQKGIIQERFKI